MTYPVLCAVAVLAASLALGCKKDAVSRYQVEKSAAPADSASMPPGHPAIDGKGGMSGEVPGMPPGHPKIDGKGGMPGEVPAMPPGHPKIDGMGASMGKMMPGAMPAGMGGAPSAGLKWSTPKGWKEMPPSGMRTATFVVGEGAGRAEFSVVVISGDGGGVLDNINRWRSQIGIGPVAAPALKKEMTPVRSAAGEVLLADYKGKDLRLLGAVLSHGGETWFFKTIAADAVLEKAKPAFLELLRSLRPAQ